MERINELLREEISSLIRRELKDPRLAGMVSITDVETAPDLSTARVFASVMGSDDEKQTTLDTLRRAAGFFRRLLRERLRLRRVPELEFRLDISLERGDRVLDILRQLEREQQEAGKGEAGGGPARSDPEE